MEYSEIVRFHGHECPGLAIGYRMARAAMASLASLRSTDEEIVAVVENDACGVDALQCVSGCTFGKGNLIFHDYGKHVYTLYSRRSRRGVRVVYHGKGAAAPVREDREAYARWVLEAPDDDLLTVREVTVAEPEPARIFQSVPCARCGENVMETRTRVTGGRAVCIPCARKE